MSPSENQIVLIFVIGTAGMLFMAVAIILFVAFYQKKMIEEQLRRSALEVDYQRKMLQAALESQENERQRVSKDLHDDVGMMLMTVRAQVNSMIGKEFSAALAGDVRQLVDDTHETVRRISWDLKPSTLERFGLAQTVIEMGSRLSVKGSIPVDFNEDGNPASLDTHQETLLFRIIQESVSNAIRHGAAQRIDIRFLWNTEGLTVTIADDGIGFDFPKEHDMMKVQLGLGLVNLENRVALLGGQLHFNKNNPSGTMVKIMIPLHG
ncbi:MAG TPA: sensor histidine kinase [Cyclobacteriaceae bacterium]|nr:sensor histidine kinase [Cyclobacteriaceae bacterium]